jgi:hypothetical protein
VEIGGVEIELCPGGKSISVEVHNRQKFCDLYFERYVEVTNRAYEPLVEGVRSIVSSHLLAQLVPKVAN